jgi:hypothetical protein
MTLPLGNPPDTRYPDPRIEALESAPPTLDDMFAIMRTFRSLRDYAVASAKK